MTDTGDATLPAATRSRIVSRPGTVRWLALTGVLLLAAALRIAAAATQPNIIWPDEVFQTVEPAHRLVYGSGLMSWEWIVGIRSWLVPALFAPLLVLARTLQLGPGGTTALVSGAMILLSLVPVAIGFRWGERTAGLAGAILVSGVTAVWVDLIYIAPHPLTDVIATDLLALALYLAGTPSPSARRLAAAGALLGLLCYLRMQLGPAALVVAGFACGRAWSRWRPLTLGGAAVVGILGALDWITLGTPLQSIWLNFYFNIIGRVSNEYGVDSPMFYVSGLTELWGGLTVVILVLAVFGRRRWPTLFWVPVTVFLTQSLVAHKEWRFIFPALTPLILLCGLQTVALLPRLEAELKKVSHPRATAVGLCLAAFAFASLVVGAGETYRLFWQNSRAIIAAFELVSRQNGACGVGVLFDAGRNGNPAGYSWVGSQGASALPAGVPLYPAVSDYTWRSAGAYNWAVIGSGAQSPPAPFHVIRCFGHAYGQTGAGTTSACAWARPGHCDRSVAVLPMINWPPYFTDANGAVRRDRLQPRFLGMTPPLHFVSQDLRATTPP